MSTTEQTGRLEMDSTESQPRIEPAVLGLAPQGGDPTPLPVARSAAGTRTKLRSVPPPIPGRATTATIPPPIPLVAAAQKPALQPDPDGWAVPASGPTYPSVYHHEPAAPDATVPTGAIEAAAEKPSPEWLAKIDSVMTDAPVEERVVNAHEKAVAEAREAEELARANAAANAALPKLPAPRPSNAKLPPPSRTASGTRPPIPMAVKTVPPVAAAAAAMFKAKAPSVEAPVINTAPLELMDLEPVDHSDAQVIDPTPLPPAEPSDHNHDVLAKPAAVVAKPAAKKPTAQKQPAVNPLVEAARKSFEAENAGDFDIDWESNPDMTSAHTTNFELPVKSKLPQRAALGLLVAAVFATGGYLATRSKHPAKHAPATASVTQPAPATTAAPTPAFVIDTASTETPATPAVAQTQPAAAPVVAQKATSAPAQLQIPVSSMPPGAFVSLVDGEKADIVGQTPMTLTLDVSKPHDVALTMVGRETQLVHVPAGGLNALAVTLPLKEGAQPAVAAAPKPSDDHITAMVAPKHETPAPRHKAQTEHVAAPAPRVESAPAPKAITSAPAGSGMLMISSKPPCEIIVDGKSTHLQTPQRALPLAAGGHTIMLVNAQMHIRKTLAVDIVAKKPTKVIQDFLK